MSQLNIHYVLELKVDDMSVYFALNVTCLLAGSELEGSLLEGRYFVYVPFLPICPLCLQYWCFVSTCSAYLACSANGILASYLNILWHRRLTFTVAYF